MNSIVKALKAMEAEAGKSGRWNLETLCKMAALEIDVKSARIAKLETHVEDANTAATSLQIQNAKLIEKNARLTAGSEAMQEDARNNTATINMLMAQLAERNKEVSQLKEKVRYAYVQIEALEAK